MKGARSAIVTSHCMVRARQRGYRLTDLEILEQLGTLAGDGILLRKKDVEPEISRLAALLRRMRHRKAKGNFIPAKVEIEEQETIRQIERLRRLPGSFIPLENGHALSIYRPCRRRLRRALHDERRLRTRRGDSR